MYITEEKLEQICRKLCNIRNEDPDEVVRLPSPGSQAVIYKGRRWKIYREQVRMFLQIREAVDASYPVKREWA